MSAYNFTLFNNLLKIRLWRWTVIPNVHPLHILEIISIENWVTIYLSTTPCTFTYFVL